MRARVAKGSLLALCWSVHGMSRSISTARGG
ncbi:unnamed protein product [Ectocarpus sp. CCAP 1310/34]|nr:unnamed protein product [Ectocarpus sp. CCAP 1310/34]